MLVSWVHDPDAEWSGPLRDWLAEGGLGEPALGQIPAGVLADRFGPKRLFFIGILGSTLLSFNFGMLQTYSGAIVNQIASGAFRAALRLALPAL